jgi:V/A-type H+-transporting ATPase subunit G/H
MELIRQIKESETTAKKMVEDAQKNAAFSIDNAGRQRTERISQASQNRKQKIDNAQAEGQKQGTAEAQQLNAKSLQAKQQLEQKATTKMEAAVSTVIDFVKKQK